MFVLDAQTHLPVIAGTLGITAADGEISPAIPVITGGFARFTYTAKAEGSDDVAIGAVGASGASGFLSLPIDIARCRFLVEFAGVDTSSSGPCQVYGTFEGSAEFNATGAAALPGEAPGGSGTWNFFAAATCQTQGMECKLQPDILVAGPFSVSGQVQGTPPFGSILTIDIEFTPQPMGSLVLSCNIAGIHVSLPFPGDLTADPNRLGFKGLTFLDAQGSRSFNAEKLSGTITVTRISP